MAIETTPSRRLLGSIQRLNNQQRARELGSPTQQDAIKTAVVTEDAGAGSFTVGPPVNATLTTTGDPSQIVVGGEVQVAYRRGLPVVILAHTGQRAKFAPVLPTAGSFVEMLLAAPTATPSSPSHTIDALDVYFRNANQTTLLKCRDALIAAGFTIRTTSLALLPSAWGLDHRSFLVQFVNDANGHPIIAVFHITGSETVPLTQKAVAKLVTTIDVTTLNLSLGSISWTQNVVGGGSVTTNIVLGTALSTGYSISLPTDPFHSIIQTAFATIFNAVYTRNKHLILSVNLSIGNTVAGGPFNVIGGFNYPYVIDVTAGTILFNGIAQQGLWPTTIYNGAAFIQVGPGLYDETGTGTNAWQGGAQFYLIPDSTGNALRVFVGLRAFYSGGNPGLAGKVQQYVEARDISTATRAVIFPLTTYASGENSHLALLSADSRYAMWMRASPGAVSSPNAFQFPSATTLAGYNFKEGIHVTDLGAGKLSTIADFIILTTQADIESFFDQVPDLLGKNLLWADHNDLRVTVPPSTTRQPPELVTFRHGTATGPVPNTPLVLPLKRQVVVSQDFATLKALPPALSFIANAVVFLYTVSGHQDMVTGYSLFGSPFSSFCAVQVAPINGVTFP